MVSNIIRCPYCGLEQPSTYVVCSNPECQRDKPSRPLVPSPSNPVATRPIGAEKRIAAGVCGILLGGIGVHKFILGYTKEGIIMLAVSLVSCGYLAIVPIIIGIIEGIVYLTKSENEFVRTYIEKKKGWF